jgi:hypothetical protein
MIEFITKLLPYIAPAIYFADNPKRNYWRIDLIIYSLIVYALDILFAHTVWAYYFGWPKRGEWTISHTLERLCRTGSHPKISLFIALARGINRISYGHIKAIT